MASTQEMWDKGFLDIGNIYVDAYLNGVLTMEKMAQFQVYRSVIIEVYKVMVSLNQITALEKLDDESKTNIWNDCKPYIESLSTDEWIEFCKCYWALSSLAQKRIT